MLNLGVIYYSKTHAMLLILVNKKFQLLNTFGITQLNSWHNDHSLETIH